MLSTRGMLRGGTGMFVTAMLSDGLDGEFKLEKEFMTRSG